jgi:hypothetical protein
MHRQERIPDRPAMAEPSPTAAAAVPPLPFNGRFPSTAEIDKESGIVDPFWRRARVHQRNDVARCRDGPIRTG